MPSTTVSSYDYSNLEPIASCCRYVPFDRGLQVSIDGHPGDSRHFREIRPVFISHSSTFLSVGGTWTYRLLPALYAHLSCTTYSTLSHVHYRKRRRSKFGVCLAQWLCDVSHPTYTNHLRRWVFLPLLARNQICVAPPPRTRVAQQCQS